MTTPLTPIRKILDALTNGGDRGHLSVILRPWPVLDRNFHVAIHVDVTPLKEKEVMCEIHQSIDSPNHPRLFPGA